MMRVLRSVMETVAVVMEGKGRMRSGLVGSYCPKVCKELGQHQLRMLTDCFCKAAVTPGLTESQLRGVQNGARECRGYGARQLNHQGSSMQVMHIAYLIR